LDIHDLKLLLQSNLSDGLVTVVGSGLSCAEGLPSMPELADHLTRVVGSDLTPVDAASWSILSPLIVKAGLESALLTVAPTPSLEAVIVAHTVDFIRRAEQRVVLDVFQKTRSLSFTRLLAHMLKPASGVVVITTNYDRLIEMSVEEAGLGVDTMFVGQFAGTLDEKQSRLSFCCDVTYRGRKPQLQYRPRVKVFKPHGSLDWYYRDGLPVRYSGDLDLPRLIITPGINKFRNGYASPFDRHRDRANIAIDQASRFLIIGYGFNDDHLETHLEPCIRRGIPTLLLTHTLSPTALQLVQACPNITAIQSAKAGGIDGSSVFVGGVEQFVPNLALWELNSFVSEVLEP
jgi:hypothetical protein